MESIEGTLARTPRMPWRRAVTVLATAALALTAIVLPAAASSADDAAAKPALLGVAKVGTRLTVDAAGQQYLWLRDGVAISGTGSVVSYKLKSADLGKRISVRVTPTGVTPTASDPVTDPTDPVEPGTFSPLNPVVSGGTKVGEILTVGPAGPTVGTVTFQWLRNGTPIAGATDQKYLLVLKDLGTKISAQVTQTRKGFTTLVETSGRTDPITSLKYLTAGKAGVIGTVALGETLTATRGSWTPNTLFKYQWYSGSTKIPGATSRKLVITKSLRGRMIKVKVTGSKPNYFSQSIVSPVAPIAGLRGPRNANGWAWPTDTRIYTSGYHDGYSIDLASSSGGPIYAPYSGTIVKIGGDGGGVPWVCQANPGWWHGENQTVIIKHVYNGKTMYSSVNHVARGSSVALGIKVGAKVKSGQQIATEGMSGCTSGPHTHFLMKKTAGYYWGDLRPKGYLGKPTSSGAGTHATDASVLPAG